MWVDTKGYVLLKVLRVIEKPEASESEVTLKHIGQRLMNYTLQSTPIDAFLFVVKYDELNSKRPD